MRTYQEKNKILDIARELWKSGEITKEQLYKTYYIHFIKNQ